MTTILPLGVIQRVNFVDLDGDDVLEVSNTIHTLKEDLSTVQLTILKVQKDLDDQLHAITLTRQTLEEAKAHEKTIVETISRGEALLAPSAIRSLPTEILSEIFLHFLNLCLPKDDRLRDATVLQAQNLLLQISRPWRQTMLSDPRFWRTITVGYFGPDHPTSWEMLEERISRAGSTQDLDVHLILNMCDLESQSRLLQIVLDLLVRATTFRMTVDYIVDDVDTLPQPTETYGNLKEVILGTEYDTDMYGRWVYNIFQHTPNLRALESYSLTPKLGPFPCFGTLRCLRLSRCYGVYDISRILAKTPLLTELHIKTIQIRPEGRLTPIMNIPITPILHEQLERLRVDRVDFEFLETLTLPGLRHLSFARAMEITGKETDGRLRGHSVEWPSHSGVSFFERSQCKLISLEIKDVRIVPEVVDILQPQECLETLYLRSTSSTASTVLLDFLEGNLSSLTRLRVCVKPDQMPAALRMMEERTRRENLNFVALESCSIVVLVRGYGENRMEERHREMFVAFIEGPQRLELDYEWNH